MDSAGLISSGGNPLFTTLSGQDSNGIYSVISPLSGEPIANLPNSDYGSMLSFLENVATGLNVYSGRVQQVFSAGTNSGNVSYPASGLANQLRTVAKLLSGGSRTKVFMVSTGGFDNHANLVNAGNTTQGTHAGLLQNAFDCIKSFQDDLIDQGLEDNVMTLVFSEFGRKATENNSLGCDHGSLSSMFLIGKGVEPGVIGNNLDLSNLSGGRPSNSQLENTYHKVYATVIQDWLGANDASVNNGVFYNAATPYTTQKLNLINSTNIVPSSCYFTPDIVSVCACVQVKVFLEGLYDDTLGEMKTDLANSASFPATQPYNAPPFNYTGTENFSTLPTDAVDWLLLELRDGDDLTNVVERQAVLLRKDGFVIQTDGTSGANFSNTPEGDYHLAIFHRNHLGILSSSPIETDNTSFVLDFSISLLAVKGRNQLKQIGSTFVMQAGDISGNQIIDNDDHNYQQVNQGTGIGYDKGDLNGDGQIDTADSDLWFANRYKLGEMR